MSDGVSGLIIDKNIIKGNTIVNAGRAGINLRSTPRFGTSDDNQVLDNTIISSIEEGISVGGKRNVIQGNTIDQSGESGIVVISFAGTNFVGRSLTSEDVIIKNNSITNSKLGGILIGGNSFGNTPASLNTVVIGNTLAGNGNEDNLLDFGSNTIEAGNIPNLM